MIKDLEQKLKNKPVEWYRDLFYSYRDHLWKVKPDRVIKSDAGLLPEFNSNPLKAFVFRNNGYYNTNDIIRNNDIIVLIHEREAGKFDMYHYRATADPKTRQMGIANAIEQMYLGNIRVHNWGKTGDRPAICQDITDVWVRRYNNRQTSEYEYYDANNGYWYYEELGKFTIHLHNPWKYYNSSLGCGITESNDFVEDMKRLRKLVSAKNIPVMWINADTLSKLTDLQNEIIIKPMNSTEATLAIVKKFQRDNGLDSDGKVGPKTIAKVVEKGLKP